MLVKKKSKWNGVRNTRFMDYSLYLASTIFVCYLSFKAKQQAINPITWNTLFWLIILFIAVNAIGKSFTQESKQRNIFYYSIVSPEAVIYSKIVYNALVMIGISFVGILFYSWVMGNPVGIYHYIYSLCYWGRLVFSYTHDGRRNSCSRRKFGHIDVGTKFSHHHSSLITLA